MSLLISLYYADSIDIFRLLSRKRLSPTTEIGSLTPPLVSSIRWYDAMIHTDGNLPVELFMYRLECQADLSGDVEFQLRELYTACDMHTHDSNEPVIESTLSNAIISF